MLRTLRTTYIPNAVVIFKPSGGTDALIERLAPYTVALQAVRGKTTAFVCKNFTCTLPTHDVEKVLAELMQI
jgi:hypothetical protein